MSGTGKQDSRDLSRRCVAQKWETVLTIRAVERTEEGVGPCRPDCTRTFKAGAKSRSPLHSMATIVSDGILYSCKYEENGFEVPSSQKADSTK